LKLVAKVHRRKVEWGHRKGIPEQVDTEGKWGRERRTG